MDFIPENLYHVFWNEESVSGVKIAKKRREQLSPGPERAFFAVFDGFWDSTAINVDFTAQKMIFSQNIHLVELIYTV